LAVNDEPIQFKQKIQ